MNKDCEHSDVLDVYTAVGPCVLLAVRPVEVVEAQTEEGSSEEAVGEGQHPCVQRPHRGQLQALGGRPDTVKHNYTRVRKFFT